MVFPVASQQCYCIFICFFIAIGFVRGWCREVTSLLFIILAVCLIHPNTSDGLNCFLGRSGYAIIYLGGASQQLPSTCSAGIGFLGGAFWSLVIFVLLVLLGYLIGNTICPCPRLLLNRLLGAALGVISGSIIIFYLTAFLRAAGWAASLMVSMQQANPNQFVPVMFIIIVIVIILALFAACFRW
jgi:hypothetical protein